MTGGDQRRAGPAAGVTGIDRAAGIERRRRP
jgi:hypothetical protein